MRLEIAGRRIGGASPVFAIAEIGLNHGGSLDRALAMVDAAAAAGASAIKLQTIDADRLVLPQAPAPAHVTATSLRGFFRTFELNWDAHKAVATRARRLGLAVMTTPFFEEAVPVLESIGFDAFKIASGDLTYDGLIAAAARTGAPLVISTGMSELDEVRHAIDVARTAGAGGVGVLHCVSAYPTPVDDENLRAIPTLAAACGVPAGLSDHGRGLASAVAAVALGADLYERHFVLADDMTAIDRPVSSTPEEFAAIVDAMRQTRAALGDGIKTCRPSEQPNRVPSRRGLYAARPLTAGHVVRAGDLVALRPASAVDPRWSRDLVGTTLRRAMGEGDAFEEADLKAPRPEGGQSNTGSARRSHATSVRGEASQTA
jgi:sialic acid synthase SpsE